MSIPPDPIRPPRVLLTGVWMVPSSGGAVKTIERFRRALDASVVSFTDSQELDEEGSGVPGAVHVRTGPGLLGSKFSWAPASARREADALAANADLISCHGTFRYHVLWMRKWAKRRGLPYWVVPHGILDPYVFTYRVAQKRLFLALIGKRHLREAAHIIFSTRRERDKAAAVYSGPNTRVVPWPVEPIEVAGQAEIRARVRAELGIGPADPVLVYLGRMHAMKRPLETIEAAALAGIPGLRLVIIGPEEGVTRAQCEAKAAALGFRGLHLAGAVFGRRKEELLLAADGFISLSIRENFGHAAAEAMSANLPVILSPGNDLVGELTDVRCGWFMNDERPETISGALREFAVAGSEARMDMGRAGRQWVCRELSFDQFRSRLQELAREALAGRGIRSGGKDR